jgi:hypothetical protein
MEGEKKEKRWFDPECCGDVLLTVC